jgi:hypothetical protein
MALVEDLERERAIELRVANPVDNAHAALSDLLDDLVASQATGWDRAAP